MPPVGRLSSGARGAHSNGARRDGAASNLHVCRSVSIWTVLRGLACFCCVGQCFFCCLGPCPRMVPEVL
eukprot:5858923-Alexandrium_andersonii.AAC.1